MENPFWPLFDLRIKTPRVEIRLATDDDLVALARLAIKGVHDPASMPFVLAWTDAPSPELERGLLQWGWRHRASWKANNWSFSGAVVVDNEVVGVQSLMAIDFASVRSVSTSSWLGIDYHRQGIGKEMRSAILHLAFNKLDAVEAHSGGWPDNDSSLGVSKSLGYRDNGRRLALQRGVPAEMLDLRLTRAEWSASDHPDTEVEGLENCLNFFVGSPPEHKKHPRA
jgi:RimJ/RimL family protein N-acetyltransferase